MEKFGGKTPHINFFKFFQVPQFPLFAIVHNRITISQIQQTFVVPYCQEWADKFVIRHKDDVIKFICICGYNYPCVSHPNIKRISYDISSRIISMNFHVILLFHSTNIKWMSMAPLPHTECHFYWLEEAQCWKRIRRRSTNIFTIFLKRTCISLVFVQTSPIWWKRFAFVFSTKNIAHEWREMDKSWSISIYFHIMSIVTTHNYCR